MRLTQSQIKDLADALIDELVKRKLMTVTGDRAAAAAAVERAVHDDLQVEDRLNAEVDEILKSLEREMERGKADYKTMFDLVKKKLARERGLVL